MLKTLWPRLVDQINARSPNMAKVFRDTNLVRPTRLSENVCTISFKYPIHAERAHTEPRRGIIEGALGRVIGRHVRLESILFEDEAGDDAASGPARQPRSAGGRGGRGGAESGVPSPYETERGRAALNIFGITQFDDVE